MGSSIYLIYIYIYIIIKSIFCCTILHPVPFPPLLIPDNYTKWVRQPSWVFKDQERSMDHTNNFKGNNPAKNTKDQWPGLTPTDYVTGQRSHFTAARRTYVYTNMCMHTSACIDGTSDLVNRQTRPVQHTCDITKTTKMTSSHGTTHNKMPGNPILLPHGIVSPIPPITFNQNLPRQQRC